MIKMVVKIVLHVFQSVMHALLLLGEDRYGSAQFIVAMVIFAKEARVSA